MQSRNNRDSTLPNFGSTNLSVLSTSLLPDTLHLRGSIRRQPRGKCLGIPRLHEHRPRSSEFAYQSLTRGHVRHDTARGHTLENVLAVPGDEVAVVDDVLLVLL